MYRNPAYSPDRPESERIQALYGLNVLDTPPEERFDRLTRLTRRLFDVPVAMVSLVDEDRQWIKSHQGFHAREIPREWSFCSAAIESKGMLVVPDALADERFKDSPLVTGDEEVRFYAGQPIRTPGGAMVGTLCVIDREPRDFSEEDQELLYDMASLVEREFAALRLATVDELTGLSNRRGFHMLASHALAWCHRLGEPAALLLLDLDDFKAINDELGHRAGDNALRSFAADLLANFRRSDVVARVGGDEFCVLLSGAEVAEVPATLEKLAERLERRNQGRDPRAMVHYSVGTAAYDPEHHIHVGDLLEAADAAMYLHKDRIR